MKIKKIESICKAKKTIIVYQSENCQWLSDGCAIYPIFNMPHLEQKNIFAMFDIPEEKQNRFHFTEDELPLSVNFNDYDKNENQLEMNEFMSIGHKQGDLLPLRTSKGIIFIENKYLAPFDEGFELYERQMLSGTPYIAVKRGFMLRGIILPIKVVTEEFVKQLKDISELCQYALNQLEAEEQPEEDTTQQEIDWGKYQSE